MDGQRRGDAPLLGPEQLKNGQINYRQGKTGTDVWLPAASQILEAISAMQRVGFKTFLVIEYGEPFSRAGFGHRKAMARRLAESSESQQSIKSVVGLKADAEVTTCTAGANQKRLASAAIGRLSDADLADRAGKLANRSTQAAEKES